MTRSERLAKMSLISISALHGELAKVISNCNSVPNLRYFFTSYDELYNGKQVSEVDLFEDFESNLYAVINS